MAKKNIDSGNDDTKPSMKEGEDFYYEKGFMVFTEAFHRKRGYCCQNGCRHCPYGFNKLMKDS